MTAPDSKTCAHCQRDLAGASTYTIQGIDVCADIRSCLARQAKREQQPAEATGGEQAQPWPRTQRMPLAIVGGTVQPWHHQAVAEYDSARGETTKPNTGIYGGYTAAQVNRAITWWNERAEAEQAQDGAAERLRVCSEDPLWSAKLRADLRAVLAERDALAARVAELTAERETDTRAVAALVKLGDVSFRGTWLTDWEDAKGALAARFANRIAALETKPAVVIGAGSPETSALTHCPTCGSPEWLADGRRGWNPVDVECEVCAGTYTAETEES